MAIRITDTSTGKRIKAKGGKDAARVVGHVLDRQWYERNIEGASFPPDSEQLQKAKAIA